MADHMSLVEAMATGDELTEAEIRYRLLAEAFVEMPQLRSQLNTQLERAKAEIVRLRAQKSVIQSAADPDLDPRLGRIVPIDPDRFRKTAAN